MQDDDGFSLFLFLGALKGKVGRFEGYEKDDNNNSGVVNIIHLARHCQRRPSMSIRLASWTTTAMLVVKPD